MKVIMVKKRLPDGSECNKCREATELLKQKGVWDQIDEIVWALESDPDSPGAVLAAEHGVDRAPFFIFERPGRPPQVVDSVLRAYRML